MVIVLKITSPCLYIFYVLERRRKKYPKKIVKKRKTKNENQLVKLFLVYKLLLLYINPQSLYQ